MCSGEFHMNFVHPKHEIFIGPKYKLIFEGKPAFRVD